MLILVARLLVFSYSRASVPGSIRDSEACAGRQLQLCDVHGGPGHCHDPQGSLQHVVWVTGLCHGRGYADR